MFKYSGINVTDYKWFDKRLLKWRIGFYMNYFLALNLMGIKNYLAKAWDVVGIISGHGKVRIGKCQKKGNKVLMADGSWKKVEDIKVGDEVVSPQEDGSSSIETVTDLHNRFEPECYDVVEESTNKLLYSCAGNHDIPIFKNNLKKGIYESKIMEAKDISVNSTSKFICKSWSPPSSRKNVYIKCVKSEPSEVYGFSITGNSKWYVTDNWMITHNSTLAQQVGYYIAWILAGGKMGLSDPMDPFSRWVVVKKPTSKVKFGMENIVFRPEELMKKADDLYKKYGKNQVIVYDEGRAGLDSAAAMTAVNKMMQEFFQECGQYNHVILIVLPNFFKLHEDYAVNRSLFLIDVYANQKLQRGYFNFYNEYQKELLYNTGKKQIGTIMKYSAVRPSFIGRFTKFSSIDEVEYNKAKRMALIKKKATRNEMRWKKQRDALLYLIKRATDWPINTIAKEMTVITGEPVTERTVTMGIANVTHQKIEEVK